MYTRHKLAIIATIVSISFNHNNACFSETIFNEISSPKDPYYQNINSNNSEDIEETIKTCIVHRNRDGLANYLASLANHGNEHTQAAPYSHLLTMPECDAQSTEILSNFGANINYNNGAPLASAIKACDAKKVKTLLDRKVDVQDSTKKAIEVLLHGTIILTRQQATDAEQLIRQIYNKVSANEEKEFFRQASVYLQFNKDRACLNNRRNERCLALSQLIDGLRNRAPDTWR